jgi:hypothetical protein
LLESGSIRSRPVLNGLHHIYNSPPEHGPGFAAQQRQGAPRPRLRSSQRVAEHVEHEDS